MAQIFGAVLGVLWLGNSVNCERTNTKLEAAQKPHGTLVVPVLMGPRKLSNMRRLGCLGGCSRICRLCRRHWVWLVGEKTLVIVGLLLQPSGKVSRPEGTLLSLIA